MSLQLKETYSLSLLLYSTGTPLQRSVVNPEGFAANQLSMVCSGITSSLV